MAVHKADFKMNVSELKCKRKLHVGKKEKFVTGITCVFVSNRRASFTYLQKQRGLIYISSCQAYIYECVYCVGMYCAEV